MSFLSIINRIFYKKIPNSIYYSNLPILLGTIRGGHTTLQNFINITLLDYLDIQYKIREDNYNIFFDNQKGVKALEALDLRSIVNNKYPFWGYIANHPGHAVKVKNREFFIFLRSTKSTYKSIYVFEKYVYGYNDEKSKVFATKYLKSWGKELENLIKNKGKTNNNFYFSRAETIFNKPSKYISKLLSMSGLYISQKSVKNSIKIYNKKISKWSKNLDKLNTRNSYNKYYKELDKREEKLINSLYINKLYINQNKDGFENNEII